MTNASNKTNFFLGFFAGMAILSVVAFLVLLVVVFTNKQEVQLGAQAEPTDNEQVVDEPQSAPVPPINESDTVFGNPEAKVVLIEYTDFECPFCARHYGTVQKIKENYGDKIAFVTRHFPLSFHANAQKASEAVECAGEAGKFWEMYDVVFQANLNETEMSVAAWKTAAGKLGLGASFNTCLDDGKYAGKVKQQMATGAAAGVNGTPATFVNGELISGALPYEQFAGIIDQLLAE